ncbi:hypothetical protein ACOSP7_030685 [Xanthoceras sorbifolium]
MGIWDYISSATDSIKRNAPDPTSVKRLSWSSYDSIKRSAPDPSSVQGFYWSTYDNSCAAVTRIHDAVRVNAVEKLNPYLPDAETRSKIAINLAKQTAIFAVREGARSFPGGSRVYDIVSQSIPASGSIHGEKKSKENKDLQELKDRVGRTENERDKVKQELNDCRRLLEQLEMHKLIMELKTNKMPDLNKKPEDVTKIFMTTEFSGNQYLADLIAPGVTPTKDPK